MTFSEVHQIVWELTRDGSAHEPITLALGRYECLRIAGAVGYIVEQDIGFHDDAGSGDPVCYLFVGPTSTLYRVGARAMGSQVRAAVLR